LLSITYKKAGKKQAILGSKCKSGTYLVFKKRQLQGISGLADGNPKVSSRSRAVAAEESSFQKVKYFCLKITILLTARTPLL